MERIVFTKMIDKLVKVRLMERGFDDEKPPKFVILAGYTDELLGEYKYTVLDIEKTPEDDEWSIVGFAKTEEEAQAKINGTWKEVE